MSNAPSPRRASYVLHVVSVAGHEWSVGMFMVDRLDLVKLIDSVLDLFDNEPRFQYFTLDGQSILLEDYLSIRPENFERVERAVQDSRLQIGPWYVQPEPLMVSTEAIIRNLMIGLRTARVFGRPMMIGYLPDAHGFPAQLPQILKSFGIETVITEGERETGNVPPIELRWKGDDGTTINLVNMYVLFGTKLKFARTALAPYSESGHLPILREWNTFGAPQQNIDELLTTLSTTQYELPDDIFHSNLANYAKAVEVFARSNSLPFVHGEVLKRENSLQPSDHFQKWNSHIESMLIEEVEPLTAWAEQLPAYEDEQHMRRPQSIIQNLWRTLLVSQYPPNMYSDTPDGLEHSEITNRLENAHRVGSRIRFTALLDIAHHVNTQSLQGDQAIVVFNGKAEPYTGIVKVLITTDSKDNVAPVITDQSGTRLGITITEMSDSTFRSWFDVQFIATVPALGYTTYCVYMEKTEGLPVISAGVSTGYEAVTTDIHDGSLPLSTSIVTSSDPGFHITAVKPPEEAERSGMIVRGYNVGGEPLWVTLTPWRPFAAVEVMTIDESPTGGKLVAESNGAVYFKAGPHRILTFWFHD